MKYKNITKKRVKKTNKTVIKSKRSTIKIKRIVKSMAETKSNVLVSINNGITTGDVAVVPYNIVLSPVLTQGTSASNQRIGNKVQVVSGVIDGYINMLPYNATTNTYPNIKVKLFLASYKNKNVSAVSSPTLVAGDFATFFEGGFPFQGNMYDLLAPVNEDNWVIHKQKVLTLSLGASSTSYPSQTTPLEGTSTYQRYFKFYFGKLLGKLQYNDTYNSPVNKNLYLIVQPITTDGSGRQAGNICEIHYKYECKYKDM